MRTYWSSTIRPDLTSGIDTFLEWFDAETFHGVDEQFFGGIAQFHVGGDHVLDDVGDFAIAHRRPEQGAEPGVLVGAAPERDLVEFLAVLLDAEDADVADMVVAAGVDAAGDVDVEAPDGARELVVAEALRQLLRDWDRAGIGEAAIVEAGAGDDVGDEPDIRRRKLLRFELLPKPQEIALRHMRQHQVLLVADADLAEAIAVSKIGD